MISTKRIAGRVHSAVKWFALGPASAFNSWEYIRHTQRRLEHLASLRLNLRNQSVLEVGAGIGDHTSFFLDRGCQVVSTEGRTANLRVLRQRFPQVDVRYLDLENPTDSFSERFDIVYCYGLLYHLANPNLALDYLAAKTGKLLLLETCVSAGDNEHIHPYAEPSINPTQALSGMGCRPTRPWIFHKLQDHFEYVYTPVTQPSHPEFPLDWNAIDGQRQTAPLRAVYIASREKLANDLLRDELLPVHQEIVHQEI